MEEKLESRRLEVFVPSFEEVESDNKLPILMEEEIVEPIYYVMLYIFILYINIIYIYIIYIYNILFILPTEEPYTKRI